MKNYIGIIAIFLTSFFSCQNFLQETPEDFLGTNFYQNEKDAAIGLNGVFGQLQAQTYYQRTVWLITELTGEYLQTALVNAPRQELENYTYTDANGEIGNWWRSSYSMINRANDLIEKVPLIEMDEAKKNHIVGNARFLRGMAYFDLVRSFGDVPLVTTTIKSPKDDLFPSRNPMAEVYEHIIEDLKFAEAHCLKESEIPASEKGRVSTGAASSMLAKVYLTRATTSAAQGGDYEAAVAACEKVIASGEYSLLPDYKDVFDPEKENGKEHIFSIQFDLPPNIGNITIQMQYPIEKELIGGAGAGSFKVNPEFVESYAAGDVRKSWNVSDSAGTKKLSNYFFYKYRDPKRQGNNSRVNWLVLRYADVLMMHSEAISRINPANDAKFNGINEVRLRAGLSPLNASNVPSQDSFIDALVMERAWELCLEGHRRFDLIRLGRLKERQKEVYGRDIEDKYFLFPIPQTEMTLNSNLTQNPGF